MSRTLLSLNNYFYARGGADIAFLRHNELLERSGWAVVPFSMNHERNVSSPWSEHFVEEIELGRDYPVGQQLRKAVKAVYSVEARRKVGRLIDSISPDLCHAHNVYHHISPSVLGTIRSRGIPLAMTLHDLKLACPAYSMLTHDGVCERCRGGRFYQVLVHRCIKGNAPLSMLVMLESYLHRLLRSYVANVDRFIVPSRFFLRKFEEWGFDPARFSYVPNFIDAAEFRARPRPGKRFLYCGRLSPEKGLHTLVRAVARAGVGIDLAGAGPEREALVALTEELSADVRFLGYLKGDALEDAIAGARAVVLPSQCYENAPLSVLEAAALGKPVIASAIGGLPELVIAGETGWVFEAGSVTELADLLTHVKALSDQETEAFGARARDRVVADFSPQRYLTGLREAYEQMGVQWS